MRRSTRTLLLVALAVAVVGRVGRRVPGGGGRLPPPGAPLNVPAVLTPATAADVKAAILVAYQALRGRPCPSDDCWLWPLALSANETARWTQLYNHNLGNVTTLGTASRWYSNPHVTSPLRFLDCLDLNAGARAMLSALDLHGGVQAAEQGDLAAFQRALDGYLGGGPGSYPNIAPIADSLRGTVAGGAQVVGVVAEMQKALNDLGYLPALAVDDELGPKTMAAMQWAIARLVRDEEPGT